MHEAIKSLLIHLGESSYYMSTDEEEFWLGNEYGNRSDLSAFYSSCISINWLFVYFLNLNIYIYIYKEAFWPNVLVSLSYLSVFLDFLT
jgi:hypothetical protein